MTDSFRPSVLRAKAWDVLRDKWGQAALTSLIIYAGYLLVLLVSSLMPLLGLVIMMLVWGMLLIGYQFIFLDLYRDKGQVEVKTILEPVHRYGRYFGGFLLVCIYVGLWSLLFYIPGIIKMLSYSMTFYIMRENPEMTGEQAIQRSMEMMKGHKMDLFLLMLSFIGWILLSIITLGIGYLWIYPYMYTARAAFYEELKKEYAATQPFEGSSFGDGARTVVITTDA